MSEDPRFKMNISIHGRSVDELAIALRQVALQLTMERESHFRKGWQGQQSGRGYSWSALIQAKREFSSEDETTLRKVQ